MSLPLWRVAESSPVRAGDVEPAPGPVDEVHDGLAEVVGIPDLLGSHVQLNVAYPLWHITLLARIRPVIPEDGPTRLAAPERFWDIDRRFRDIWAEFVFCARVPDPVTTPSRDRGSLRV